MPQSSRSLRSSADGTWRRAEKNHRVMARSTAALWGKGPASEESRMRFGCPGIIRSAWNPCRSLKRMASGKNPICRSSQVSALRRAFSGADGFHGNSSARGTTGTPIDASPACGRLVPEQVDRHAAGRRAARAASRGCRTGRRRASRAPRRGRPRPARRSSRGGRADRRLDAGGDRGCVETVRRAAPRAECRRPASPRRRARATVRPWSSPVTARARRSASPSAPTGA